MVQRAAVSLDAVEAGWDPLLERIGDARFVLLGEASHGTHEFYAARAAITKRLILEKGFCAIAVEADWPDAYRVNRYVRFGPEVSTALDALGGFVRFPRWMWRNADVLELIGWLRDSNEHLPPEARVGFYGLDLYSLYGSLDAVLRYLREVDPPAAERAKETYACFDRFGEEPQTYGYAASIGLTHSCERGVVATLLELRRARERYLQSDGLAAEDEFFFAEQNARVAANAAHYYRAMFLGRDASWNLRDGHMAETLEALSAHLARTRAGDGPVKIIVWAHNSHLGDARATSMGQRGELNLGQLVRERHGKGAVNVGFTTDRGTVTAASDWDGPAQRKRVRPSLEGSYEHLFHRCAFPRFYLDLSRDDAVRRALRGPYLERAIGVIYLPETERVSHYFYANLPEQFEVVVHFDETRAVEPIDRLSTEAARGAMPETYPSGV